MGVTYSDDLWGGLGDYSRIPQEVKIHKSSECSIEKELITQRKAPFEH